jgi:4-hydroxy-2-oxoglutarate aldolase
MGSFDPSLHMGATGAVLTLASIMPEACIELYELFTQGLYERARELSAGLLRLDQIVSKTWGVAGVKAAMDLVGLRGGARAARPPGEAPRSSALVNEGFVIA